MKSRPEVRRPRRARTIESVRGLALPAVLLSLLLVLAACGNDDGDAETAATDDPTQAPAAEDSTNATDDAVADDPTQAPATEDSADATDGTVADDVSDTLEDLASDTGSATVTIGDETFEFSLAGTNAVDGTTYVGRCDTLFGMIAGSGFVTDGRDITVDLEVPPVDWETYEDDRYDPPAVEVEDSENNAKWVADTGNEFITGSAVGEFEQDGTSASGTATFVNEWAPDSDPVDGTFEIDCEG